MPVYGLNQTHGLVPYMGDKGDKNAARPPEGSLVETRCLIKGPKSAIVPFPGPRSGPKSRTGPGALAKSVPYEPDEPEAGQCWSLTPSAMWV